MTAQKATHRRVISVFALAAGAALALSSCSTGQISQTARQQAAVNGAAAQVGPISLRDVYVLFPNSEEYTNAKGGKAALAFVAVNTSEVVKDTLKKISTDISSATITPDAPELKPQRSLTAGEPVGEEIQPASELAADEPKPVTVELTDLKKDIFPGLTVAVTFSFEKAGDVVVNVPVDARDTERFTSDKSGAEEHGGTEEHGEQAPRGGH